jgi:hypothetical protein
VNEQQPLELAASPFWIRAYVLIVMVLLPLDWFAPTGAALREMGGKPAILAMLAGGACGLLSRARVKMTSMELNAIAAIAAFLSLGFAAALLNFVLGWSDWFHSRNPFVQLASQGSMIAASGVALVGNSRLMRIYPIAVLGARYLPVAVAVQMTVFGLEALGLITDSAGPLLLFRSADLGLMDRPSGLFSEPAYFGTFAALYGSSLMVLPATGFKRFIYMAAAAAMYACAVLIGAKTFVVVAGAQAVYFVLRQTRTLRTKVLAVFLVVAVSICGVFFIQVYGALNVESNLSSAVRLGSSVVAANAALAGYGLPGIGIGQFHFFYRNEFAPDFIYASWEALLQLSPDAENRASTYNFYIRILVELGLLGMLLFLVCIKKLWFAEIPAGMKYAQLLFAGSLGFLMTQDTYFYPPLVFAAALIMSMSSSPARSAASFPARAVFGSAA